MSNNNTVNSPARDRAEWNEAWTTVSKLAAARQVALRELALAPTARLETDGAPGVDSGEAEPTSSSTIDQGQLEDAIAEIEQASAALKSAEPALEPWLPETVAAPNEKRRPRSIWIVIATIWLTTALAIAGVVGAIGYLLV